MQLQDKKITSFQRYIWEFYKSEGRHFLWRTKHDPYAVVISEIMLQQTQTHRVAQKFPAFLQRFPNFKTLACSSLRDVLLMWQGLGYNRRGKYLQEIAQKVMSEFDGVLPDTPELLVSFPGIGKNTAGSICAFAFNKPTIFIETNIRTVFIHFFFQDQDNINDKEIIPLIQDSLDHNNAREWYYALMDYGVMLKKILPNPSRRSAHHAVQSKFEGSDRQIRGMVLRLLTQKASMNFYELNNCIDREPERIKKALKQLCNEGLIKNKHGAFLIN